MSNKQPHCHIHRDVALICPTCRPDLVIDRAKGGRNSRGVTSKAKAKASAANGALGGRPKLPKHSAKCDVDVTGRYTKNCPRCMYDADKIETQNRRFGHADHPPHSSRSSAV